jgi:ribosome-binding factor A
MSGFRPVRVGELIQAEIAELMLRHLKDPRLKMSTISHVEVSSDLRHAKLYISHLGSESEQEAAIAGFKHAAGFIRKQLGKRLKLRYIPQLSFQLDTAIAYGVKVSHMLHDLVPSESATATEGDRPNA